MTDAQMALLELVEQEADTDLVDEMLAFAAKRMMKLEVEAKTGAAPRSPVLQAEMVPVFRTGEEAIPDVKDGREMKTTRKRYTGEFKAKVALEAIRGELTLAELASKHGIHPTMIAIWKRQAIKGMAVTFLGTAEATKAAGETELEKLHAKIGQLVIERDFCSMGSRDERRAPTLDDRAGQRAPVDRGAVPAGVDQPVVVLLFVGAGDARHAGTDGGNRRDVHGSPLGHGSRQMARHLQRLGHAAGRRRVRRLMVKVGLAPIY